MTRRPTYRVPTRLVAVLACLAALAGAGRVAGAGRAVEAEGHVRIAEPRWVVCQVMFRNWFQPVLDEIVPEWTYVEEGDVVARLRTPLLSDELDNRRQKVRLAEASLQKVDADGRALLAGLEADLLAARASLQRARDSLEACRRLPTEDDREMLDLELADNRDRHAYAVARGEVMRKMKGYGLAAEWRVVEAEHQVSVMAADKVELESLLSELIAQNAAFEAQKAEVAARKAEMQEQAAQVRWTYEGRRVPLLRMATRLGELDVAQRDQALSLRRADALVMRAPTAGRVVYGQRWDRSGVEKISTGKPIWFGQGVARIVRTEEMMISARVAERDLFTIAPGNPVEISFDAIPDATYHGEVSQVLSIVRAENEWFMNTDIEALDRKGTAIIEMADADERIRLGMSAKLLIATEAAEAPARASAGRGSGLVLKGWLKSPSLRFVRAPFTGRVVWSVEAGSLVKAGDPIVRLDPGLSSDWDAETKGRLERLECLREAAELDLQMKRELRPLLVESALADVATAELALAELESHPTPPERIAAQNAVAEAEWQAERAAARLASFQDLRRQNMASEADVKRRELLLARAESDLELAMADLDEVMKGAPDVELAVAGADLKLAQAAESRAKVNARTDIDAAQAALKAAEVTLASSGERAERVRKRVSQAEVTSPVDGLTLYSPRLGEEMREGWWVALVAETSNLEVHAALDEAAYGTVKPGSPVRVVPAGMGGRSVRGHVSEVVDWRLPPWWWRGPKEDKVRQGKLYAVVVALDEDMPACVGMSALVEVLAQPQDEERPAVQETDTDG